MKCWSVVLNQNFSCLFFKIRKNMNEEVSFKNGTWKKRWSIKIKEEVIHKRARYEQKGHSQNLGAWRKGVIHKTVCEPGDTNEKGWFTKHERRGPGSTNEKGWFKKFCDVNEEVILKTWRNLKGWLTKQFAMNDSQNLATWWKGVVYKTVCNMNERGDSQNNLP